MQFDRWYDDEAIFFLLSRGKVFFAEIHQTVIHDDALLSFCREMKSFRLDEKRKVCYVNGFATLIALYVTYCGCTAQHIHPLGEIQICSGKAGFRRLHIKTMPSVMGCVKETRNIKNNYLENSYSYPSTSNLINIQHKYNFIIYLYLFYNISP